MAARLGEPPEPWLRAAGYIQAPTPEGVSEAVRRFGGSFVEIDETAEAYAPPQASAKPVGELRETSLVIFYEAGGEFVTGVLLVNSPPAGTPWRKGDRVLFQRDVRPHLGEYVLVRDSEGQIAIVRYFGKRNGRLLIEPLAGGFTTPFESEVELWGVISGWLRGHAKGDS